jgi:hypothetical protein
VSGPFPSWDRSILTEIYLCHACSYHEIGDGNGPDRTIQPTGCGVHGLCAAGTTQGGGLGRVRQNQRGRKFGNHGPEGVWDLGTRTSRTLDGDGLTASVGDNAKP